jgi:hypothetical protein
MRFSLAAIGIACFLLINAGCSSEIKSGAAYNVSIIAKDKEGRLKPQGPIIQVGRVIVQSKQQLEHEGQTFSLLVRKTQYGKATFEVTFPDQSTQMFQVKVGEAKDILPKRQKFGVRVELEQSN